MKKILILFIPAVLALSCTTQPEPSKVVVISGRITDEDTKKGIDSVSLTIYDQDTTIKGMTDAEGAFNLVVKKKSDYNFKIESGDHVPVNGSFNFFKSDSVYSSYELTPYVNDGVENDSTDVVAQEKE